MTARSGDLAFWMAELDRRNLAVEDAKAAVSEELSHLATQLCPYIVGTEFILSEVAWPGDCPERYDRRWRVTLIEGFRPPPGRTQLTNVEVYLRGPYLDDSGASRRICLATLERLMAQGHARLLVSEAVS